MLEPQSCRIRPVLASNHLSTHLILESRLKCMTGDGGWSLIKVGEKMLECSLSLNTFHLICILLFKKEVLWCQRHNEIYTTISTDNQIGNAFKTNC